MTLLEFQKDLRRSYCGGGVGTIISGLVWAVAAYMVKRSGVEVGFITLFFGGMLIFPLATLVCRIVFKRTGTIAGNPGGRVVIETLPGMFVGLFLAYLFIEIDQQMVFPVAAMAVGAHYFSFKTAYGDFTFWLLGAVMVAIGSFAIIGATPAFPLNVAEMIAITEVAFGVFLTARNVLEER